MFPPVEAAHQYWMGELHQTIASVCLLPRLSSRVGSAAAIAAAGGALGLSAAAGGGGGVDDYEEEESTDEEEEDHNHNSTTAGRSAEADGETKGGSRRRIHKDRTYRHLVRLIDPSVFTHAYGVINGKQQQKLKR